MKSNRIRGQSTLEVAITFIVVVLLVGGIIKIWFWANNQIVERQLSYNATRVTAGTSSDTYKLQWPVYAPPDLKENEVLSGDIGSGGASGGSGGTGGSGGGTGGSDGSSGGDEVVPPIYDSSIDGALEILSKSRIGAEYADLINGKKISVEYEDFSPNPGLADVAAYFNPERNIIRVNLILKTISPEQAIAALICHEATHADYWYNPQEWIAKTKAAHPELSDSAISIPRNSIDQEYNAYRNEVLLWQEVKGGLPDVLLDGLTENYNQGEAYFKTLIALVYMETDPLIPEY